MIKYLVPFLVSFILTIFFIIIFSFVGKKIRWAPRKTGRHIHKKAYRIGGVAMALAFNVAVLLNKDLVITSELLGLMVGTMMAAAIGLFDDIKELYWKYQLFFQVALATLTFVFGVRIYYVTNPLTGGIFLMESGFWVIVASFLFIFWVILVINAVNWLDGVDGLLGGVSAISALTIFVLCFFKEVNQPPVAIISIILFGTILGFLIFNFYPAKILAGTSGSMYVGLALAVLSVFSGTKIATALLVLSIPIIDLVWVIGERIRRGKSIFKPDKNHLHHRLLELGWTETKISAYYYLITALIAAIALNTRVIGKGITLSLVLVLMLVISFIINKKISHKRKQAI